MSYTQTQIDAMRAAIATGAMKVRMNGEEVTYRTLAEMRSVLAEMERDVTASTRPTHFNPAFDRGI
jgi:hypothetical protein